MTANLAQSLHNIDTMRQPMQPHIKRSAGMTPGECGPEQADRHLDNTCAELESLFIHQLLKQMRAAIPKSDLMGGGQAEELYTAMLDGETAKELAARGGIGLAALLKDQLLERMDLPPGTDDGADPGQNV